MTRTFLALMIWSLTACVSSSGSADLSTIPRQVRETFPIALAEPTEVDFTPSGDSAKVPYRAPILVSRMGSTVLYDGPISLGRALVLRDRSSQATVLIVRRYGMPGAVGNVLRLARQRLRADGMIVPPFESDEERSGRFTYEGTRDGIPVRGIVMASMTPADGTDVSTSLVLATEYPVLRNDGAMRAFLRHAADLGMSGAL